MDLFQEHALSGVSKGRRRLMLAIGGSLAGAVFAAIIAKLYLSTQGSPLLPLWCWALLGAIAGLLLFSKHTAHGISSAAREVLNQQGPWPRPEAWELGEDGISMESPMLRMYVPWELLVNVEQDQRGWTLHWQSMHTSRLPANVALPEEAADYLRSRSQS